MLNIAIISDIHANLPALKAVLEDIDTFKADQVYCLGDLTDGAPWNNEVIQLIRQRQIPTIMGNHDERIAFDLPVRPLSKHSAEEREARIKAIQYTKDTITSDNKSFLAGLPQTIRLDFGPMKLLLAHGSTRSNDEYIYQHHDEQDLLGQLNNQQVDVLIIGHTHISYIQPLQQETKMVINAGSVGRTKEKDGLATYLQLTIREGNATLLKDFLNPTIKKVSYPVHETIEAIRESPVPDFYANFLANSTIV